MLLTEKNKNTYEFMNIKTAIFLYRTRPGKQGKFKNFIRMDCSENSLS
jgi:hypothetical protein